MPMNPMQKRAQQSFIIGFLLALIIMAIVVAVLVKEVQKANESLEELKALQRSYVVAADDLKSGQEVNFDEHFTTEKVQTTVDESQVISMEDFEFIDYVGSNVIAFYKYDDDVNELVYLYENKELGSYKKWKKLNFCPFSLLSKIAFARRSYSSFRKGISSSLMA